MILKIDDYGQGFITKVSKPYKKLRKLNKYTQDDLADLTQIARSTLGNIETAQNDITFSKLNKIAKAFDLSLAEFLNHHISSIQL